LLPSSRSKAENFFALNFAKPQYRYVTKGRKNYLPLTITSGFNG